MEAGTVAANGTFTATATDLALGDIIRTTYSTDVYADKFSVDALEDRVDALTGRTNTQDGTLTSISGRVDEAFTGTSISNGTIRNTRDDGQNPVNVVVFSLLTQAQYAALSPVAGRMYAIRE